MDPLEFRDALQAKVKELVFSWEAKSSFFSLTVGHTEVFFNRVKSSGRFDPEVWFQRKHESGMIHEPGLIATWVVLAEMFKERTLFFDIGALFGYHSAVFSELHEDCVCVLVEGNQESLCTAKKVNEGRDNFSYVCAVVGTDVSEAYFFVDTYNFYPLIGSRAFISISIGIFKDIIKFCLKKLKFRKRYNFSVIGNCRKIKTTTLTELLSSVPTESQIVVKIDSEGHQSEFLRGKLEELFSKRVVVCLELDRPSKMREFHSSNKVIVDALITQGFSVLWLDHREPKDVILVQEFKDFMDRNSLVVALPDF